MESRGSLGISWESKRDLRGGGGKEVLSIARKKIRIVRYVSFRGGVSNKKEKGEFVRKKDRRKRR